jgi:YD repeat-containing protein
VTEKATSIRKPSTSDSQRGLLRITLGHRRRQYQRAENSSCGRSRPVRSVRAPCQLGDSQEATSGDWATWDYAYDGSGRLTSVTEPSSAGEPTKITTITYDSAERVGTITQPDSTTEKFSPAQVQGWTNSGTTGSPAPSVLLAEVGSTFTDALGNVTTDSPDWRGMGLTNQDTDALGDVTTTDRNANGLATITIDPLNRITQDAYDSHGNVTKVTYPDLSTTTYGTYNSFAEPSSMTDQLGRITTYTITLVT